MKFFMLLILISNAFAETCNVTPEFVNFIEREKVLEADDPRGSLAEYAKSKKITSDCAYSKMSKAIPTLALKWINKAKSLDCFSTGSEKCPVDLRNEVLGSISLIDQWSLWIEAKKTNAPDHSLCPDLIVTNELDDLTKNISPILKVLKKEERLAYFQSLQTLKCQETYKPNIKSFPNYKYFVDLKQKGTAAPIEEFLKFWSPVSEKEIHKQSYTLSCASSPWGQLDKSQVLPGFGKVLAEECKPDVLYSWGPEAKLESIKAKLLTGTTWSGPPNGIYSKLYMSISPVASFGYGAFGIRIKLKPNIPFVMNGDGEGKSIGVRGTGEFHDFKLRESSAIESWSYGTHEQYDEIVRDLKAIQTNKAVSLYAPRFTGEGGVYVRKELKDKKGLERLYYGQGKLDSHPFTEKVLKENLLKLIDLILAEKGNVVYQKGTCQNSEQHFHTKKRTYFNPH